MRNPDFLSFLPAALIWPVWVATLATPEIAAQSCEIHGISTEAEFEALSSPSVNPLSVRERSTKFLMPVDPADTSPVPLVFQDVNEHGLHLNFLVACFPDDFSDLGHDGYRALVEERKTRRYWAGVVSRIRVPGEERFFGFDVVTRPGEPSELLMQEEAKGIFLRLKEKFLPGPLRYAPATPEAREAAGRWPPDPELPVFLETANEDVEYVPYTKAVGYGWVRRLLRAEFEAANSRGLIGRRDILVLERSPRDIEGVFAGAITAELQGELSHLAIRTARRNTPNAFVDGALEKFAPWEGLLVKLVIGDTGYTVTEVTDRSEAEAFWAENRPALSEPPVIDADYDELDSLEEMDLDAAPEARFGGKAANLARLQRIMPPEFREPGFGVPVRYYLEFMRTNTIEVEGRVLTYDEYLRGLFSEPEFEADPARRFEALENFREHARENGTASPSLATRLAIRVLRVFGATSRMVRFRSSSNVEDALEFNGAGLYESTSTCAADTLDLDDNGPSRCDRTRPAERSIERALKKVWTSLWTFRAFEERSWYQIPQDATAMGILVTRAFLDEKANGVAFTGNPSNRFDRRFVVVAQLGEDASVVSPEPGVLAEKNLLEVDARDGTVTRIHRVRRSTLAAEDERVLSDDQLREIGSVLWRIDREFPLETGPHAREDVLFDVEFKVEADGSLAFKQVRPFLTTSSGDPPPTFVLEIPEGTEACGVWTDARPPADVLALKSRVVFRPGPLELPTAVDTFTLEWIESVETGPDREPATPLDAGLVEVRRSAGDSPESAVYTFTLRQTFEVDGRPFHLELADLAFTATDGRPDTETRVLDQDTLTWGLNFEGETDGAFADRVRYGSCTHEALPLHLTSIDLEGGHRIELEERYRKVAVGSAPADFVHARVVIAGEERVVTGYWNLVYSAFRHNERVRAWVLLDPPADAAKQPIHAVEVALEDFHRRPPLYPPEVAFLDAGFSAFDRPAIVRYCRREPGEPCASDFRRGDADADGKVNITDAFVVLNALFLGGDEPACADAADFDDLDGVLVTDAILILSFLFLGVDLSAPPGPHACGPDPTPDALPECRSAACP